MAASGEKYLGDVLVLGMGGTGAAVCRYLASQGPGRVSSVTLYGGASSGRAASPASSRPRA